MHLTKYTEGWTRRHFFEQVGKGVFAAGVLSPLMDVIGRNGTCEAAYPPELLSIEVYTKGKLKPGDVLSAENVDIVKGLLDPGAYWQIKHDRRLVDLAPTESDITRPMFTPVGERRLQVGCRRISSTTDNSATCDETKAIGYFSRAWFRNPR